MLKFISDNTNPDSLASRSRRKRFEFFLSQLDKLEKPLKILDIGGTERFWEMMNFTGHADIEIYLLNLEHQDIKYDNFKSVKGDATDLKEYSDDFFDLVFSNSVIEHLFTWENQVRMAEEVKRVGKNYFIQTPNYWFPIEPHFVFPLFQYLPKAIRIRLIQNFNLGNVKRHREMEEATRMIEEIQLLSIGKMKGLFPNGNIYFDKFLGLNKSIIAYNVRG